MTRAELSELSEEYKNDVFKRACTDSFSVIKDVCNDDIISTAFEAGFLAGLDAVAKNIVHIIKLGEA